MPHTDTARTSSPAQRGPREVTVSKYIPHASMAVNKVSVSEKKRRPTKSEAPSSASETSNGASASDEPPPSEPDSETTDDDASEAK